MTSEAPDHGHRFAVYSPTGTHIGLWSDGKIAAEVAAESSGNTVEELVTLDHALALVAETEALIMEEAIDWVGDHDPDLADKMKAEAKTPDAMKALAAREARDKRIREEALREAADLVRMSREFEFDDAGNAVGYTNPSPDEAAEAILALIERRYR